MSKWLYVLAFVTLTVGFILGMLIGAGFAIEEIRDEMKDEGYYFCKKTDIGQNQGLPFNKIQNDVDTFVWNGSV